MLAFLFKDCMLKKSLSKPKKPYKYVVVERSSYFYFDHISNKINLNYFLDWCKKTPPKQAKNINISLVEDIMYDLVIANIKLSWEIKQLNPDYDKELKNYNKDLAKWRKQCQQ